MKKIFSIGLLASCIVLVACKLASAETLMGALNKAYSKNSMLNSDRATIRIYDEDIAIAKSGYRPSINVSGDYSRSSNKDYYDSDASIGIQLNQRIFDGFMTKNSVAAAEMQAQAQREFLHNSEQNLFLQAVQSYVDVYTARRIAVYRKENLSALEEQVRVEKERLRVGERTRTDLAQSEAQRSQALSLLHRAYADVKLYEATYRRVIGDDAGFLESPPTAKNLPNNIEDGLCIAALEHPAILSAKHTVDATSYSVKIKESARLPQIDFTATTSYNSSGKYAGAGVNGYSNSFGVRLSVPVYQGGALSSQIRQSKEKLGQAQIQEVSIREQVREQLVSAWSQLDGAKSAVTAYRDSVRAAKIALEGRIQENLVGQATTLDVLNSRAMVTDSQVDLVLSERDVVVASYAIKVALGRLTASDLGLHTIESNFMKLSR